MRAIEIEITGAKDTLATKHDVSEFRSEMRQLALELRAEMHEAFSAHTRQMYLAIFGQTTVMLGLFYFFLTQLR